MHSRTTAREILDDFAGRAARLLGHRLWHRRHPEGRLARAGARSGRRRRSIVCEPADAALLASGEPQARNPDGSPPLGHPAWKPHPIQGWTPDFIPKLTGDAVAAGDCRSSADRLRRGGDATAVASWRARKASSSASRPGATFAGALAIAREAPAGLGAAGHAARHRRALPLARRCSPASRLR